jgi:two-component system cell cycle response regulator
MRPISRRRNSTEQTSLETRLGVLLLARAATVVLVLVAVAAMPAHFGLSLGPVAVLSAIYLAIAGAGQAIGGVTRQRRRISIHQLLLPLDSVYLAALMATSGGAQSDLLILFTVQLIAVTLLASTRTGVRIALWDSVLLIAINVLSLGAPVAHLLGFGEVTSPAASVVAVRIMGFWAVALCTACFSSVSERELRRSKGQLDALTTMAAEMEASNNADEIMPILLRTVMAAFDFRRGAVLWERGGRAAGLTGVAGSDDLTGHQMVKGQPVDAVAQRSSSSQEPVLVRHLDPLADPALSRMLPDATNVIVLALPVDRERVGILAVERAGAIGQRMTRSKLAMLRRFSAYAALALRNAYLLGEVARLAASDGLTGLANRREFETVLSREVQRMQRTNEPLSVAVIDVDHFKAVNDTLGHLAGDQVLRDIAAILASAVRDMDLVARYGGEEFALVLPNCTASDAMAVIERVRVAMAVSDPFLGVTVSAGVATAPRNGTDEATLVAAADEALYASKRDGRDRVTLAWRDVPSVAL